MSRDDVIVVGKDPRFPALDDGHGISRTNAAMASSNGRRHPPRSSRSASGRRSLLLRGLQQGPQRRSRGLRQSLVQAQPIQMFMRVALERRCAIAQAVSFAAVEVILLAMWGEVKLGLWAPLA